MQTFLPYPDFVASARVLDSQRLGKQRVECLQILRTLLGLSAGWRNHPAVRMWRGHEAVLRAYALSVVVEWKFRGFRDTCHAKLLALPVGGTTPPWLGRPALHLSHRSNLVRKFPEYYRAYWPTVSASLPYVWPV